MLLALTCAACLFYTGPVFGFGALQAVMERDGEYEELCTANQTAAVAAGRGCPEQENALAVLYTVGGTLVPFMSLPAGLFLDMVGPAHSTISYTFNYQIPMVSLSTALFLWPHLAYRLIKHMPMS